MTSSSTDLAHLKYRADIDGLRAIAVLSVVGFHASPYRFPGGFIGVDIFFVISGFLISTIIFRNLQTDSFSFSQFYARRVKRIFPALLVVLLSCLAFGWLVLLPDEYKQLGKHTAGGVAFISNFLFLNEVNYFDNVAETKPLLHLWSLGIEEQFYIIWPILVWGAWRLKFGLFWLMFCVAAVSFGLNLYGVKSNPTGTFFSPQTRAWELLCGSLLAWVALNPSRKWESVRAALDRHFVRIAGQPLANVQAFLGLALLVGGILFMSKSNPFPGYWAVVPTLGAILVIAAGSGAWLNRVVLSNKFLVWFGLISFPLYLWHWPLLSFARILEGDIPARPIRGAAIVAAIVLAWLTYKFIEKPLRFGHFFKNTTAVLSVTMVLVGGAGMLIYLKDGLGFRVGKFDAISKAVGEWDYPGSMQTIKYGGRDFYVSKSSLAETTLFIGDSNIEQYAPRPVALIKQNAATTNSVVFATAGGCLPIPNAPYLHKAHCGGLVEAGLAYAAEHPEVTTVVIGAEWNQYLSGGAALVGTFGHGSVLYKDALINLSNYIQAFKKLNKRVFLIQNIPISGELDPRYLANRGFKNFPQFIVFREGGVSKQSIIERFGPIQDDLRTVAISAGAKVINPLDWVCNASTCPSSDERGVPMYKDAAHLRPSYVRQYGTFLDVALSNEK